MKAMPACLRLRAGSSGAGFAQMRCMDHKEIPQRENAERLYGRRSNDRPEMARIFCAPFAAQVWGNKQPAQSLDRAASLYSSPQAQVTGRLLNRLA
jgi:hypothetical protein